nr:unnamed protein product [Callosobruchus analis]
MTRPRRQIIQVFM